MGKKKDTRVKQLRDLLDDAISVVMMTKYRFLEQN